MDYSSNWEKVLENRLKTIYKNSISDDQILKFKEYIAPLIVKENKNVELWNEQDIALITYGDSILKKDEIPLKTLNSFISNRLASLINIIHILPFFPFSSDDGFSVIDFELINPELGNWSDIKNISENNKLMADLVINHVSSKSEWFTNYKKGKGEGVNYFIEESLSTDLSKVTRPRSSPLLSTYETNKGPKHVWTTFSDDQIDLNFSNPEVLLRFLKILQCYISNGARIIRLDAIAFLWKEIGTTCLHLDETHEVVKLLRNFTDWIAPGLIIITETNVPNKENLSYFGKNDEAHMVYQFSLPPLLLHALNSGSAQYLTEWAQTLPKLEQECTFFNFTSSHDGIGVRPLEGLLPENEKQLLYNDIKSSGGLISMKSNSDGTQSPYELNITYYDALKRTRNGEDDMQDIRFINSQSIMLAMKGVPAFYIHSILASNNYKKGVDITGRARTINREKLDINKLYEELNSETSRSFVFNELCRLISIRKSVKVFHPSANQKILDFGKQVFAFERSDNNGNSITVINNMTSEHIAINYKNAANQKDLISNTNVLTDAIELKPYQFVWLSK